MQLLTGRVTGSSPILFPPPRRQIPRPEGRNWKKTLARVFNSGNCLNFHALRSNREEAAREEIRLRLVVIFGPVFFSSFFSSFPFFLHYVSSSDELGRRRSAAELYANRVDATTRALSSREGKRHANSSVYWLNTSRALLNPVVIQFSRRSWERTTTTEAWNGPNENHRGKISFPLSLSFLYLVLFFPSFFSPSPCRG